MKRSLLCLTAILMHSIFCLAQTKPAFSLHSHNDYLQDLPFWEAYNAGCTSIEVDVLVQNGELMAAHDKESILKDRTLKKLYLEPIAKAISDDKMDVINFHLLIDFKTEAYSTMEVLINQVKPYTSFLYSETNPSGLKLVISGNRPKPEDYRNYPEWAFFDYQSMDLTPELPWERIGIVSLSFARFSKWDGKERLTESDMEKLESFINLVHTFNRPVRFWAAPDNENAWKTFFDLGVDFINTDNPSKANQFLNSLSKSPLY
jgi:alkaline phosphatase